MQIARRISDIYRPNFFEIGSRVLPPDANNCCILNLRLLGNGGYYGNLFAGTVAMAMPGAVPSGYHNFVIIIVIRIRFRGTLEL